MFINAIRDTQISNGSNKKGLVSMNTYYVYQLIDPRNNLPFYIGQGKGNRAWSHLSFKSGCNNPHKDRIIKKIQKNRLDVKVEIVKENLTKLEAIGYEAFLIEKIGLSKLSNICKNANPPILIGEQNGFYGKTHSDEIKKKLGNVNKGKDLKSIQGKKSIGDALKARWNDPIERKKLLEVHYSRKGEKRSLEAIESYKISARLRNLKMTAKQRSDRSRAGAATVKIKYAGMKKKCYFNNEGKKRFKWIPAIV
jgi:hypothetical protein